MILADILQWFLLVLGAFLTLNAYWLGARALCPSTVGRARNQYERRPVRASLIGALITVPVVLASILLASQVPHPVVQIGAVGLLLVLSLVGLVGSAGLAERIGQGLPSPHDASQPWRQVLRGGLVLGLAFLMPFLGWFLLLPWTLISGVGAWYLAGREPQRVPSVILHNVETVATVVSAPRP